MRRFLIFVGLCLTCFALTFGQYENGDDMLSNEIREMVRNAASLEEITAQFDADRQKKSAAKETCTISIKGSETAHIEEDPLISARVECGGIEIYNEEKKRSELKRVIVRDGWLYLFKKLSDGMMTYVYLKDADNIELKDVVIENLPKLDPLKKYAAPFVADSGRFDCNNCNFTNNADGQMAGALVLTGSANVDMKDGTFYGNRGTKAGAVLLSGSAKLDIEHSIIAVNNGTVVGGIMVDGSAMIIAKNIHLQENEAKEQATSIYIQEKGISVLDEMKLVGQGYDESYEDYLLAADQSNYAINEDDFLKASAFKMAGKSSVIVRDTVFANNAAKYGAVLVAEQAVLTMNACHFTKNAATNGAGVYIEGGRGGYARVMGSTFVSNVARNGGALVSAGNGSFVVDECHFESNMAFRGGVLYGDYSNEDSLVANGTCSRTSSGNRMTIQQSTFTGNMAVHSGGAFFVKCTEIFANESAFTGNMAQSNGGAMYVAEAHSLDFLNCVFKENSAGDNGGSLYVKNAQDIMSTDTVFANNSANLNSDAFASLTGDDSHSNNINITHDDTRNGGALYAEDVNDLIFQNTIFRKNSAGGIGGSMFVNKSNDIMITDTVFLQNTADLEGGAIASMSGNSISLTEVIITRNSAKDGGAVFSFDTKKIQSQQCDLRRNVAVKGGALSMHNLDELYLEDVDLSSNVAEKAGGAVRAYNGKKATIKNVIVTDIKSGSGSLALEKIDTVLVSDIDFHDNIAEGACGALEIDRALDATLRNVLVRRNVANFQGGGVCLTNSETAKIQDVTFLKNTAGKGGGALLLDGSTEVFLNSTDFVNNVGVFQGGAIKGKGVKSLLITFSNFKKNEAQLRGGAIYLENSSLDIEDCKVTKNYVGPPKPKKTKEIEAEAETVETEETTSEETAKSTETADVPATEETAKSTETAEVAAKEQPETDDPNEPIVFANRVLATDAGGIIYLSKGEYFKSVGTNYTYNEAQSVGGAVMIESVKLVDIQFDKYLNGTAAMSGGCIYGSGIANFSMWDTTMKYCEASNGGGFILEGNSHFTGGYNKFINNTATNGGAFLCKGDSHVTIGDTAFRYNAAKEGATLSVDCRCDVDVDNSAFFRDKKLKGNGDFFHVTRGCGSVNHNGCEFHGKMPSNGVNALWAGVGGGFLALVVVFFIVIVLARRRSKRKAAAAAGDVETGTSAPLLAGRRTATAHSTESGSSYETETEEDDSVEYEEVSDVDRKPRKRSVARSIVDSEEEDISSVETENDTDEEEITVAKRKVHEIPTVPVVSSEPIGLRTPKEVRAATRHRKASMDALNDGAGPSLATNLSFVLPPSLPPKLKLNLSMSSENTPSPPEATVGETGGEGEIQSDNVDRQPTIPEDTV